MNTIAPSQGLEFMTSVPGSVVQEPVDNGRGRYQKSDDSGENAGNIETRESSNYNCFFDRDEELGEILNF